MKTKGELMQLTVTKILEQCEDYHGTSKVSGKPYVIRAWYVNATVNGHPASRLQVKTMERNFALAEGWSGTVEKQEYNGNISYFIDRDNAKGGAVATRTGASGVGGVTTAARTPYTLADLEAVMRHAYAFASNMLGKEATSEDISRTVATYTIQACNMGLKVVVVPKPATSAAKTTFVQPDDDIPFDDNSGPDEPADEQAPF